MDSVLFWVIGFRRSPFRRHVASRLKIVTMSMCLHVGDVAKEAVLSELFFIVFSAIKAETLEGKTPGSELGI